MCGHSLEEEEEELSAYHDDDGRHNIWNDLLTYITDHASGYRIQQSLEDEEVARVGLTCRFALDCLCTEMYEFCHVRECVRTAVDFNKDVLDVQTMKGFGSSWVSAPAQELRAPLLVLSPTPCLMRFPLALACLHCHLYHMTFPLAGVG